VGARLRLRLAVKIFFVCVSMTTAVSLAGGVVLYRGAARALRQEVRAHLMAVAATGATQVDAQLHSQIRTRADESSDAYRKIKATLVKVRDANPEIFYVYTMRRTSRKDIWEFVVDADSDPSHVGDQYDGSPYPEMAKALYHPAADWEPAEDQWGIWLSGYAPIRDEHGHVEAILGVDMSLAQLRRQEATLRRAALNRLVVGLLLSILIGLVVTRAVLKPVRTFISAAQRVSSGDLDFQVQVPSADEVGEFARAFNNMIVGLRASRRDLLTGLYNHMHFHEQLQTEVRRAARSGSKLCVLAMDVDRFKSIDDLLGHPIGDSVLRQLGALLREHLRSADVAARHGGDEIAVILPETDLEGGLAVAERIRAAVEQHAFSAATLEEMLADDFAADGSATMNLTVTIGLAAYPDHHPAADGLIVAADTALAQAKHVARNTVRAYDPAVDGAEYADRRHLYPMLGGTDATAIQSVAAAMDSNDRYTFGHAERVASYALEIGRRLGLDPETLDGLKVAGLLHDLGKIGVPAAIVNKPGSLTQAERALVRRHPVAAEEILRRMQRCDVVIPAVAFHHERWDGAGYPGGLAGEDIPLGARILAAADAFDAMTSQRAYRRDLTLEEAILELRTGAGKQFDPEVIHAFLEALAPAEEPAEATP
jgi:diguanylate cyclase (GGDEF)-like protein